MKSELKMKVCKNCNNDFMPARPLQSCCGARCALMYVRNKDKNERKLAREKLKSRTDYVNDLQKIFNKYIRLRDAGKNCIACGKPYKGICHASHYLSVGAHPEKRFNENNVHGGCQKCNVFLHGNLINYRLNLINKIGLDEVEKLENHSLHVKLTLPEIKDLIIEYRNKCKKFVD
jgi:hypothetical protein